MKVAYALLIGLLLCFSQGFIAEAHPVGGSFEKKVGPYLIDIGYDVIAFDANQEIIFDFALIEYPGERRWRFADFNAVDVRVQKGDDVLFEKTIDMQVPSPAFLPITFPANGDYTLSASFRNGQTLVADASFPLQVGAPLLTPLLLLLLIVGAAIAIVLAVVSFRQRSR